MSCRELGLNPDTPKGYQNVRVVIKVLASEASTNLSFGEET